MSFDTKQILLLRNQLEPLLLLLQFFLQPLGLELNQPTKAAFDSPSNQNLPGFALAPGQGREGKRVRRWRRFQPRTDGAAREYVCGKVRWRRDFLGAESAAAAAAAAVAAYLTATDRGSNVR